MREFSEEDLQHIKELAEHHDEDTARQELAEMHPADIAELYKNLELPEFEFLYQIGRAHV